VISEEAFEMAEIGKICSNSVGRHIPDKFHVLLEPLNGFVEIHNQPPDYCKYES
jgi:hypothetical protein